MPNENIIQTPFGIFNGVTTTGYYPEGSVKEIRLAEKNMLITHAGELVPYYGEDSPRRKYKASVTFYQNGMVRAVSLEAQQEIQTPIGEFPAELVTFYDTGELKRAFPLDGKISGFWSEEDERGLNLPFHFEFDFSSFTAMLVGICFYKSGDIKSITLFPGELVDITTPNHGVIRVRNGFSLFESGLIHTIEPAAPTPVKTPIGTIIAYDTSANGINADFNSIRFDALGRLIGIVTSSNRIAVKRHDGTMCFFAPGEMPDPEDEDAKMLIPLKIDFNYENNTVAITDADFRENLFGLDDAFLISKGSMSSCSAKDCSNCSLCS